MDLRWFAESSCINKYIDFIYFIYWCHLDKVYKIMQINFALLLAYFIERQFFSSHVEFYRYVNCLSFQKGYDLCKIL